MPKKIKFIIYTLGPVFLLLGVFLTFSTYQKENNYSTTTGKVIATIKTGYGRHDYYYPEIQYTTTAEQTLTFDYYTFLPTFYTTGNTVKVLYNPQDPNDATVGNFIDLWLWPIITLFIGLAGTWGAYKFATINPNPNNQTI